MDGTQRTKASEGGDFLRKVRLEDSDGIRAQYQSRVVLWVVYELGYRCVELLKIRSKTLSVIAGLTSSGVKSAGHAMSGTQFSLPSSPYNEELSQSGRHNGFGENGCRGGAAVAIVAECR